MTDEATPVEAGTPVEALPDVTEDQLRLAEALVFASAEPVSPRALARLLPDDATPDAVMAALAERYAGHGVTLAAVAGGWQFRTAPDLAPRLLTVVRQPRRLPRAAMETLAIIAYHQPVTRAEIERLRGVTLTQATVDALLEAALIAPRGRKDVPGRPTLWATTDAFLEKFGLSGLADLPKREDLLVQPIAVEEVDAAALPDAAPDAAAEDATTPNTGDDATDSPVVPPVVPPSGVSC